MVVGLNDLDYGAMFFFSNFYKCKIGFLCDGSGVKFVIMSFISLIFVATNNFFLASKLWCFSTNDIFGYDI
jgi:hypothetical protein